MVAFGFSGCKKYPKGPILSFNTKKSRIVNLWKIKAIIINDTNQVLSIEDNSFSLEIKKNGTFEERVESYIENDIQIPTASTEGKWQFDSSKENILMTFSGIWENQKTYKILKLKTNELWLENIYTQGTMTRITEKRFVTK